MAKAHNKLLGQAIFSVIFGLILVAIGIESMDVNSQYLNKVASPLITQEGEVMIIAGVLVMVLGLAITAFHYFRNIESQKIVQTTQ